MNTVLFYGRRRILKGLGMAAGAGLLSPLAFGLSRGSSALQPPGMAVDSRYFGMHMHGIAVRRSWVPYVDRLTAWPEVDFGSWRLWDAYVAWPNLQPHRNRWDFSVLDHYIELAIEHDVEIVLPLGLTPAWASTRPDEKSSYKPGNAAEPANLDDWRIYVRTVARRYKGRIRIYEIWNEINLKGFYTGDLDTMVTLARIAYEEIKSVDPDALVVSPSITGDGRNPEWLDRYLARGGGKYADVIGYHFYVPKRAPEAILPVVRDVKAIMSKHGIEEKPLWNTEAGWWIDNLSPTERLGAAGSDWLRLDQQTAAAYVSRALILNWAAGVSRFYWYAWDNRDMGLYDVSAQENKFAAHAYTRTVAWMRGAKFHRCENKKTVWVCELEDRQGMKSRIVWRESGKASPWQVPLEWAASEYESLAGVREPVGEMLQLGQHPVMLR